ncbi:MAG: hypothetical protein KGL61_00270 [Burkholderiales bacterium]|nr:hypothetical protein [Burkholderiales bacterium]
MRENVSFLITKALRSVGKWRDGQSDIALGGEKNARMERERDVTLAQQLDARYHAPDAPGTDCQRGSNSKKDRQSDGEHYLQESQLRVNRLLMPDKQMHRTAGRGRANSAHSSAFGHESKDRNKTLQNVTQLIQLPFGRLFERTCVGEKPGY